MTPSLLGHVETPYQIVHIPVAGVLMEGHLRLPENASGIVLFAQASGSARYSPRNQFVAETIRQAGIGTLLFDLLMHAEEPRDGVTCALRFDIKLLARRLIAARRWLETRPETRGLKAGCCGAGTGGAAALMMAAELGDDIAAVVSRGGRPDLAGDRLPQVKSPTLLIVGGHDETVMLRNEDAYARLRCEKEFQIVPGATHLFEERGRLEQVAQLSAQWFSKHLASAGHDRNWRHHGHARSLGSPVPQGVFQLRSPVCHAPRVPHHHRACGPGHAL